MFKRSYSPQEVAIEVALPLCVGIAMGLVLATYIVW